MIQPMFFRSTSKHICKWGKTSMYNRKSSKVVKKKQYDGFLLRSSSACTVYSGNSKRLNSEQSHIFGETGGFFIT